MSAHEQRRQWVAREFGSKTSGTTMSNAKKTKLLKVLWKKAKRKFK